MVKQGLFRNKRDVAKYRESSTNVSVELTVAGHGLKLSVDHKSISDKSPRKGEKNERQKETHEVL